MFLRTLSAIISLVLMSACAGYRLGQSKPSELGAINSIYIPLFENETQEQRLASLATNSMVDAVIRDGTYRIEPVAQADAQLLVTIKEIDYDVRRTARFDSLRAVELYMNIIMDWNLVDRENNIISTGKTTGRTQFPITTNQQISRANAYPDALKDASESLVLRIANGF